MKFVILKDEMDCVKVLLWRNLLDLVVVGKFLSFIDVVVISFNDEVFVLIILKIII